MKNKGKLCTRYGCTKQGKKMHYFTYTSQTKHLDHAYINKPIVIGVKEHMTLEFGEAVKALEEHIEILKLNLLFLMAERKSESMKMMTTQEIITIKRELDKAVQERMKLSQIYCSHNNSSGSVVAAVPATATSAH